MRSVLRFHILAIVSLTCINAVLRMSRFDASERSVP
jgi:hypothetical protein